MTKFGGKKGRNCLVASQGNPRDDTQIGHGMGASSSARKTVTYVQEVGHTSKGYKVVMGHLQST